MKRRLSSSMPGKRDIRACHICFSAHAYAALPANIPLLCFRYEKEFDGVQDVFELQVLLQ